MNSDHVCSVICKGAFFFKEGIMKQAAMDGNTLYLPEEITTHILKRLPIKSLIRFQCVCNDWKNLIQNPSFISDHLQQPSHENPSLLLERDGLGIPLFQHLDLLDFRLQVHEVQNSPSKDSLKNASIVGSCNGIICLEIHHSSVPLYSLSLWNPATTAVRHVPRASTDFADFDDCVTGFGFSSIVNDYKIVRIYAEFDDVVTHAIVFSLNQGTWKEIGIGNLKEVEINPETVTANGAIYWPGIKQVSEKEGEDNIEFQEHDDNMKEAEDDFEVIVSFDIAKEEFTVIPWPDAEYMADGKLTVYENKLALLCDIWEGDEEIPVLIDLWVLDEGKCAYGETWSWTRRYTSGPLSCTLHSMTIWRNEIVCIPHSEEYDDKGRIINVLYMMDVNTNEVNRFVIPGGESICGVYNYVESLASVGNNLH